MKRLLIVLVVLLGAGFAVVYMTRGSGDKAEPAEHNRADLTDAQKAEIRRFWAVYSEAAKLQRQGRWEQAAAGYQEALEIDPAHEDALYYLGNVMFEMGEYEAAVHAWRKLTDVNPLAGRAYLQLGAIHSCGAPGTPFNLDIALADFERALEINKEHTGPVLKLGEVYLLRGESPAARSYFEKVLRTNPGSIEANYLSGYLAWQAGDGAAALSALQRAVAASVRNKPSPSASGEGDTRGKGPMLAEGAGRKSLFTPAISALGSRDSDQVSADEMEVEYNELHRRVRDLVGN